VRITLARLSLSALICVSTSALAEDPPADEAALEAGALESLRAELVQAKAAGEAKQAQVQALTALLNDASIALDNRKPAEERAAAVQRLGEAADERALPLIWAASHANAPDVRAATIRVATRWSHPDVLALLAARVRTRMEVDANRSLAIQALATSGRPEAADALYALSGDQDVDQGVRSEALQALEKHFPDFLLDKDRPAIGGQPLGTAAAIGGSALTGGIMLGSVGVWGQGEAAVTIGGLGGAAIGAGTAALYVRNHPLSKGQGLRYASNVGWGLAGGMMASHLIYGNQGQHYDYDGNETGNPNMSALLRTLGVGIGAGTGYARLAHNPSLENVLKSNATGLVGSQIGRSSAHLLQSLGQRGERCENQGGQGDEACRRAQDRLEHDESRVRTGAAMAGSALGLAVGTINQDVWSPSSADALFSGVVAAESMVVAGLLPAAVDSRTDPGAAIDLAVWSGLTAGMLYTHGHPVSTKQSTLIGYGALAGNLLGTGVGLLPAESVSAQTHALIVIPAGLGGTALGAWSSAHLDPSDGDWNMVGVGTALSAAQITAITYVLAERDVVTREHHIAGVIMTGTTLASAGFLAATRYVAPEPIDSRFMGSAAAWGAIYGSMGQVALDTNLSDGDAVLVTTLAADVGLGIGGWILSDKSQLTPHQTLVPQLFGLTGATLGSLGVMLATEEGQPIAIGALSGATLGFVAGSVLAPRMTLGRNTAKAPLLLLPRPHLDPPGDWTFSALPALTTDGQLGAALQLSGYGF